VKLKDDMAMLEVIPNMKVALSFLLKGGLLVLFRNVVRRLLIELELLLFEILPNDDDVLCFQRDS